MTVINYIGNGIGYRLIDTFLSYDRNQVIKVDRRFLSIKLLPQILNLIGVKTITANTTKPYIMISPSNFKLKILPENHGDTVDSKVKCVSVIEQPLQYKLNIFRIEVMEFESQIKSAIMKFSNFKPIEHGEKHLVNVLPWERIEVISIDDSEKYLLIAKLPPLSIINYKLCEKVHLEESNEFKTGKLNIYTNNKTLEIGYEDLWWNFKNMDNVKMCVNAATTKPIAYIKSDSGKFIIISEKVIAYFNRNVEIECWNDKGSINYFTNLSYYSLEEPAFLSDVAWASYGIEGYGGLCFTIGDKVNVKASEGVLKFKCKQGFNVTFKPYIKTALYGKVERTMLEHYHRPIIVNGKLEDAKFSLFSLSPDSTTIVKLNGIGKSFETLIFNFSSKPTVVKVRCERFVESASLKYGGNVYFKGKVVLANVGAYGLLPLKVKLL